ncbi:MAG: PPC domain-containing protein, partial [Verrucomicrobiota bacterium]
FYRVVAEGAPGDTCQSAASLVLPVALAHTTAGYRHDAVEHPGQAGWPGPDRHYRVRVPAQARFTAEVRPEPGYTPVLLLHGAADCGLPAVPLVALAPSAGPGLPVTLAWTNLTSAALDLVLVVDSTGPGGGFALNAATGSLLAGDTPDGAEILTREGTVSGTTLGYANDLGTAASCLSTAGPDRFYRITLPAGRRLRVSLTPTGGSFDPSLNLLLPPRPGFPAPACVAASDVGLASATERLEYNNPGAGPFDLLIAVDTFSARGGAYSLTVGFADQPAGDVPLQPLDLAGPGTVNGSLEGCLNDLTVYPGWRNQGRADRFYRIHVPAGERLLARLTPTGFDAALALLDSDTVSGTPLVVLAATDAPSTRPEATGWMNTSGRDRAVTVAVETASTPGSFALVVELGPPPAGDQPGQAEPLAGPGAVAGTTEGFVPDATLYPGLPAQPGPDRFHRLTVPAGRRLTASLTHLTFDASLILLDGAAATAGNLEVLAWADEHATGGLVPEKVFWLNPGPADREVVVAVDSFADHLRGSYLLLTELGDQPPGDSPATAEELAGTLSVAGTITGYADDRRSYPAFTLGGPDRFFRVEVPARQRLVATLTPRGFNGDLVLLDPAFTGAPDAGGVLGSARTTSSPTGVETLGWFNAGTSPRAVLLVVDTATLPGLASGDFTLGVELAPPPPGELPAIAEVLPGAGSQPGTLTGFLNDVSAYPGFIPREGNDRFYRVTVPAGKRLTVTLSNLTFDASLALLDGAAVEPGGLRVLDVVNENFTDAGSETASWWNTGPADADVIVGVESWSAGPAGTYLLTVALGD